MPMSPRGQHHARRSARFWLISGAVGAATLVVGAVLGAALQGSAPQPPLVSQVHTTRIPITPWTGSMAVDENGPRTRPGCAPTIAPTPTREN